MRTSFTILILIWFSETSSLPGGGQTKGFYSNPKMIDNRNIFSPRMDYDEWTPLGRGDPLKNDPTYDYVPPVLERVHYWMDPSKRTPDPPLPNSGVLVLGSRTEATTRPTTPRYHAFQSKESQADSRIDTSSLLDPFFKLMDVSQFNMNFNSNPKLQYKPNRIQRPHYQRPPQALQRPPYTMLMPPPPPPVTNFITSQMTTVPSAPTNTTTIDPTVLANTENVFKAVAISMPGAVRPVGLNETQSETKKTTTTSTTTTMVKTTTTEKATTTTTMVLPIVTLFDNLKKPEEFKQKQQQVNSNHLEHTTYKPLKTPKPFWTNVSSHRATTPPSITTTKINTLTTDPMFKHYKQPSEPIRGPFYLIIQGHSKVKTYGASKNPINRLLTSNEIKYDEEDGKKGKFERKVRKLAVRDEEESGIEGVRSIDLTGDDNLESLEETFPKSSGGTSKKRYLGSNHRRRRSASRRLLEEEEAGTENLDLESLIAISDDYDPEDVASILLKQEGSPGSGFGGLAASLFGREG